MMFVDLQRDPLPAMSHRAPRTVALTPRGDAAVALYRFLRVLRALGAEDRAYIVGMLAEEMGEGAGRAS